MQYGWILEKQKWNHLLAVVSGTSWSKTTLDELYCDDVPKRTGVYAICATIPNFDQHLFEVLYNIIYVGKADRGTLHRRFLDHCRRPERGIKQAKECFGDNFEYWYAEVNPDRVTELERRLIECFGPPANRIGGQKISARLRPPQRA